MHSVEKLTTFRRTLYTFQEMKSIFCVKDFLTILASFPLNYLKCTAPKQSVEAGSVNLSCSSHTPTLHTTLSSLAQVSFA